MMTNALNPDIVKTLLDDVFFPEFNLTSLPEIATADDAIIFHQYVSDKAQESMEEFKGIGEWTVRAELQNPSESQPQSLYLYSFVNDELARGLELSGRLFDDDQHAVVDHLAREFALKGRMSRDKMAMGAYRTGFSTIYGDAVALFAANHPIDGGVQTNIISDPNGNASPKLSEFALQGGINTLALMKERDGSFIGRLPYFLLADITNYKRASIILESELRAATANNDQNVYSTKYNMYLKVSPYIGAQAGGSNDYWFLGAQSHPVVRFSRKDVNTTIIDRSVRQNDSYYYRGQLRQSVGAASYVGIAGSAGTYGSYDV